MKIKEKKQPEEIKNVKTDSKLLKAINFFCIINEKAKKLVDRIKKIDELLDNADLTCTKTDGITKYNFNNFTLSIKFIIIILRYRKQKMINYS